jgi:electron transfer flavoprotein alpha subunit
MNYNKKEYSGIWILAEQSGGRIEPISYELLTRALSLAEKKGSKISAMIFGKSIPDVEIEKLISRGADTVVVVEDETLEYFLAEPFSQAMTEVINAFKPEILLAGATSTGRTAMPLAAIKVDAGLTADCTVLDIEAQTGNLLQTRPAIGGNILATIKTPDHRPQMATIRPHSTPQAKERSGRSGEIIRYELKDELKAGAARRVAFEPNKEKVAIIDAERVVVVGRGIKKAENMPLVYELAEALGAAVGATRDVVDRGWLSYPHQVGLSGHTISPKLYVGIGVSGAIQHLAGMQTAGKIVVVNNDSMADIFKVADVGIVGSLFDVVPGIIKKLKSGGSL